MSFHLGQFIADTGVFGWLAILAFLPLLVVTLVVCAKARSRAAFLGLAFAALIPLLIGGTGTALGYYLVQATVEASEEPVAEEEIAQGQRQAQSCVLLGGVLTSALLLGVAGGYFLKRPRLAAG